jgi:hypothetical protein
METPAQPPDKLLQRFQAQLAEGEASDRTFGVSVGAVLLALGLVPVLKDHRPPGFWMLVIGALLLVTGVIAPGALRHLKRGWLFLGFLIGLAVSPVALGVLFYLVITPCGWLMRLFGGDPLRLRPTTQHSYWRERSAPVSTMHDPF